MTHPTGLLDPRRRIGLTGRTEVTRPLEVMVVPVEPDQAIVSLTGELDVATAALVSRALDEQLTSGHRFVRLDLSWLTFLDCAGLRALVLAHNDFLRAAGTLVLTGVGPHIARLLALTHLDDALFVADGPANRALQRHLVVVPRGVTE